MQIIRYCYTSSTKPALPPSAMALGFFDGVHLGHRALIKRAIDIANERGLTSAVLTFPSENEKLKSNSQRLYTTEEKLSLLKECGVDIAVVVDFDSVSDLSPESFVDEVLIRDLRVEVALSGTSFRFGHMAKGDFSLLEKRMKENGRSAIAEELHFTNDENGDTVLLSSSIIRQKLKEGKLDVANAMLGSPYRIQGKVVHGRGQGRSFGFPTVNLPLNLGTPLRLGVYSGTAVIDGRSYPALTNIGACPTVGEREVHAEAFLLDFEGDLYEKEIIIYIKSFIREERSFESVDALCEQIRRDVSSLNERNI